MEKFKLDTSALRTDRASIGTADIILCQVKGPYAQALNCGINSLEINPYARKIKELDQSTLQNQYFLRQCFISFNPVNFFRNRISFIKGLLL